VKRAALECPVCSAPLVRLTSTDYRCRPCNMVTHPAALVASWRGSEPQTAPVAAQGRLL